MTIGMLFWILYIVGLVFYGWVGYSRAESRWVIGGGLFWWVLIFLLGWKVFGFPVQG